MDRARRRYARDCKDLERLETLGAGLLRDSGGGEAGGFCWIGRSREDRFIAALDRGPGCEERAAAGMEGRIGVVGTVGPVDAGKHRLEGVIVALRDRIELVIVAAGAMDGEALEGAHHRHHVVVAIEVLRHEMVDGVLTNADHEGVVPGAGGEEAEGRNRL